MRIAQVAPLFESVPPKLYGGTERVVAYLTDELVRQGHSVTLFASGDSRTAATLVPVCARALRLAGECRDTLAPHLVMIEKLARRSSDFDVVHFHIGELHFPIGRRLAVPHVTTLHGRQDLPELGPLYDEFAEIPVVSISDAQRAPLPHANWVATVPHGLPRENFEFHAAPGDYFAFLGRISPEKRVDRAVAIARAAGVPLRIAAKVDAADVDYFNREIADLLRSPGVEYIGEITETEKSDFLGRARALLFPIDWPEPFGLVMIEALACGTPVIAFNRGSVTEVIDDGITGFIVDNLEDAIERARRIPEIDRAACRAAFERRFTAGRMAANYVQLYRKAIRGATRNLVA
jgi:glycosyltransferase involved in cell wall biosynthesis